MRPGLLLIVLTAGCALDAEGNDVRAYREQMLPVLQKNALLAQEFLDVASKAKKGELDGSGSADRFRRNAVPLAQEIAARVASIDPKTDALQASHDQIVKAWSNRATAYRDLATAWQAGDAVAYDGARAREVQVRLDEEAYMASVNAVTAPHGVVIDLYP